MVGLRERVQFTYQTIKSEVQANTTGSSESKILERGNDRGTGSNRKLARLT